jgi:uncharacterized membrane protein YkoI
MMACYMDVQKAPERRWSSSQNKRCNHFKIGGSVMKKKWIAIIGSGVLVIGLAVAGASFAKSDDSDVRNGTIRLENQVEADFPAMAKITRDQAVQKALASVQGQVLKIELEDENGFLVYGVEVVTADKSIVDIKVDAGSGKVLAMDRDKADDEEHESGEHGGDRDRED